MRSIWILIGCLLLVWNGVLGQKIIINEIYNSSGNDEWVELIVVEDNLDLRNWSIRDYSSSGSPQAPLQFTSNGLWSSLKKGTIIVVARPENTTLAEDLDPADYLLIVKSSNTLFFSGNVFLIAGSSEAVQIRDPLNVHIFGVSWGSANAGSLPNPKVHFNLASSSGTSVSFTGSTLSGITDPNNWTFNNSNVTLGIGNNAANSSWISSLRPQSAQIGSGIATVAPTRWKYNTPTTLTFILKATTDTLRGYRFIRPKPFSWSNVNVSGSTGNVTVSLSTDTVKLSNFVLRGSDSIVVTIMGATAADTTDEFTFDIRSSKDGSTFLAIQTQPKTLVYGSPRPMSVVKAKDQNGVHRLLTKWAVVKGIVTVGNEFAGPPPAQYAGPAYMQDATAGMAIFDSSVVWNISRGDEVLVLGLVAPFNDLFELTPAILLEKISEGNPVDTVVLTAAQINSQGTAEPYEARLIRIDKVTVNTTSWNVTGSGSNYNLTDATGVVQTRISPRVNLANLPTPNGPFDMIGVLGQFGSAYQILPRFVDDIILEGFGPRILSQAPFESQITASSLRFTWKTDLPSTTTVRYGATTSYGSEVTDTNRVTQHTITVAGLLPATLYNVQLVSANVGGTTTTANYIVSTASKSSTGIINVYFNKSVNTALARGENAQTVNLLDKLLERITAAKHSIDCALYSLSNNIGQSIANDLVQAKNRGVKLRMIIEKDNVTINPNGSIPGTKIVFDNTITPSGIPWIADNYDALNNGVGLHHNKFFIFDYRDTTLDTDDWVWTGSWNPTDPGTNDDMQNAIEIQDQALAGAYTVEFNEMWGSSTDTPNAAISRFGARKLDNTPHLFVIGGVPVECYFSPSDKVTSQILKTVNFAQHSINIAMLTLTRSDIATALKAKRDAGVRVRGVLDNGTDTGSQFNFFVSNQMDFKIDVNTGLLHHKYAVIDAEMNSAPQVLLTGSHNWSSSAENSNNENTLILRSNRIANLYLQEFAARYKESGGADNIVVGVERIGSAVPTDFSLSQNYPNPFNPTTGIEFHIPLPAHVSVKVFDLLGREQAVLVDETKPPGVYRILWDASRWPSGVYYYRLVAGGFSQTKKIVLLK